MPDIAILFTSTISPGDFSFVGRKGTLNRLDDYIKAFKFYNSLGFKIVWIDNSNYDLSFLNSFSNTEYFSFLSLESFKGKGHGELEIIKYGLENSKFLDSCSFFVKISGRYMISNFIQFISKIEFTSIKHFCNFSRNLNWADTRIIVFEQSFLNNFFIPTMDKYLDEPNGEYFEKSYARAIHFFLYSGGKISLWPIYPFYYGINGESGKIISFSLLKKIKYFIFLQLKRYIFKQTI